MMTKRILACAALAIGCLAQIALALPDLVVSQLDISPAVPTDGLVVTVTATIENVGHDDTDAPFFVRFTSDGQEIDLVSVSRLPSGRTQHVSTAWTATAGPHVLSAEIDAALDRIEEEDEENNLRSLSVNVRLDDEALAVLAPQRIAVARFDDVNSAGFINIGEGVAEELADRFAASGLRVLDHDELDTAMQSNGLNPAHPDDVALAGRLIGADLLILGSVVDVHVQETSLSLGFLRLDNASVDIRLSAQVIDVHSSRLLTSVFADGHHEGTTGFSIDVGQLLSFLTLGSAEVCTGGLQADRAWYNAAQTVLVGYRNTGAPAWYGVEIYTSTGGFLEWLGWQFVGTDGCGTWSWNQRNSLGFQVSPGIYAAKLWDGTSYIDTVGFQIRPGISISVPPADEITVGTPQFADTVVGAALSQAIDRLTSTLLLAMADAVPETADREEAPLAAAAAADTAIGPRDGQIAAILPDGRLAINLGATSGVTVDDRFEVLEVEELVVDPHTNEILAYDVASVKGIIRVVEVRERVSYAVVTGGFLPIIGDVVRPLL